MVRVPEEARTTGSDYLKADFAESREITSVVIIGEGKVEQSTFENETKTRIVVPIRYDDQRVGDPTLWSLNPKSANVLSELFGDDSSNWTDKVVDITFAGEDKMRHILADKTRTKKSNPNTAKTEALP